MEKNRLNGFSGKGLRMTNNMIRIWIHTFFGTKDIMPLIKNSFEEILYIKIKNKIEEEYQSPVRKIKGTENHLHILFMLNPCFRVSDILKNVKGESSHWINQNRFLEAKFSWEKSYEAYSVSESMLEKVSLFIENQKSFHSNITFPEERELFHKKINPYIAGKTV